MPTTNGNGWWVLIFAGSATTAGAISNFHD
jgi:hypothetical protein